MRHIDDIRKEIADNKLPLELFLISRPFVLNQEVATKINAIVVREAVRLDERLHRFPRGNGKPATRESTTIMKEMVLALLKEPGYDLSEAGACKILGWRRPVHQYFSCVRDVMAFHRPINNGECSEEEANLFITEAYATIKEEIYSYR